MRGQRFAGPASATLVRVGDEPAPSPSNAPGYWSIAAVVGGIVAVRALLKRSVT